MLTKWGIVPIVVAGLLFAAILVYSQSSLFRSGTRNHVVSARYMAPDTLKEYIIPSADDVAHSRRLRAEAVNAIVSKSPRKLDNAILAKGPDRYILCDYSDGSFERFCLYAACNILYRERTQTMWDVDVPNLRD